MTAHRSRTIGRYQDRRASTTSNYLLFTPDENGVDCPQRIPRYNDAPFDERTKHRIPGNEAPSDPMLSSPFAMTLPRGNMAGALSAAKVRRRTGLFSAFRSRLSNPSRINMNLINLFC